MRSSKQQPPPEAAIEIAKIAKEAGFAITAEDIQSMQSATVELSDAELEGAAGGMGPTCGQRRCLNSHGL